MRQQSTTAAVGAALQGPPRPMSVDDAVRAVLSHRAAEIRCFGNEDDMEGPRTESLDVRDAPPAP